MLKSKRVLKSALGVALVAGLSVSAQAAADLRVAHLSPDAPNVDIYLDGDQVLSNVPYAAFSTYLSIESGMHQVQVFAAGTDMNPVIDATLDFADNSVTTVAATGLLGDGSFGPILLEDARMGDEMMAWVRFIHTSADAPAVDITLPDGTVLFDNVMFNEAAGFLPVNAGEYDLQVRLAGSETTVLSFGDVALENDVIYSVFATGTLAEGTLGAMATVDAPGDGSTTVILEQVTESVQELSEPLQFGLNDAYPNPFNPSTTVSFQIPENQMIRLAVYNMRGQLVEVLAEGMHSAGNYQQAWNAAGIASGVYYINLASANLSQVKAVTLLR